MPQSALLFKKAQQHIPGGVNSPVRAFGSVGGTPPFIQSAHGAHVTDVDGKRYIDYVGSWGPMILGHAHPGVVRAVQTACALGLSFGAPTEAEISLAETICELMPSIQQVRLVSSGTEAAMAAIRLARGHTGRDKIIKFKGCYHGHADSLLVDAGSGALSHQTPTSEGVTQGCIQDTLVANYNDLDSVKVLFKAHDIAAVLVEPIAGNMNCVLPQAGFLEGLRALCTAHGALLVFDEVMTGFRVALGGAQSLYGITPDLTVLGKIIGGGLPVGAFGGRKDVMANLSPLGGVYQAGTLSGNPIATAAGIATLKALQAPGVYQQLQATNHQLQSEMQAVAKRHGVPFLCQYQGGMFGWFFTEASSITNATQASACNQAVFKAVFHGMLARGIYMAPSPFEAGFISLAHNTSHIDQSCDAFDQTLKALAGSTQQDTTK